MNLVDPLWLRKQLESVLRYYEQYPSYFHFMECLGLSALEDQEVAKLAQEYGAMQLDYELPVWLSTFHPELFVNIMIHQQMLLITLHTNYELPLDQLLPEQVQQVLEGLRK
jgi:hypothetical protein